MGAVVGKPVEDLASAIDTRRAEDRLAAAERVIVEFELRRSPHDGLLAAVDDIVLLKEMQAFPTDSAAGRRMNGALHAAMSHLMKEVTNLRVWDGSRLEGTTGLRFAVEKLSASMASRGLSSSLAFLTGDSISTARTGDSTGELSSGTVEELYVSGGTVLLNGQSMDELILICPGSVSVLHGIALRVIRAGYTEELLDTFTDAPCDVLDRFLSILQAGRSLETDQVISYGNIEWWTAEEMIRRWILATRLVERALVTMQMQLHAHSNGAFDRFKDEYLTAIAKRSTSMLLRFADGFTSTRSPEKLMCVLEMYEVLGDVVPSILLVFTAQHKELMSRQAEGVLAKLARALRVMMGGLVTKIRAGVSSGTPSATGVHPLTRCTMACIGSLAPHHVALDMILASTGGDAEGVNSFGDLVSELIASLEANLAEISAALCGVDGGGLWHLFQANNTGFVLKHADVLEGDDWAGWRQSRVEQHVRGYVQASWAPVAACLKAGKADVKILGKFNSALEKTYIGHARCEVPDPALRAALRKAVSGEVLAAYDAYLLKHPRLQKSARYTTVAVGIVRRILLFRQLIRSSALSSRIASSELAMALKILSLRSFQTVQEKSMRRKEQAAWTVLSEQAQPPVSVDSTGPTQTALPYSGYTLMTPASFACSADRSKSLGKVNTTSFSTNKAHAHSKAKFDRINRTTKFDYII